MSIAKISTAAAARSLDNEIEANYGQVGTDAFPLREQVLDLLCVVEEHRVTASTVKREIGLVDAPDFNLFDFLRDDETGLSRILAWILDPAGSHGQEDVFLIRFLEYFEINVGKELTADALVRVEAPTALIAQRRRRIDVRVRIGGFTLAIENKPWAGWQGEQVRAYSSQLRAESKTGFCLVLVKGIPGEVPATQLKAAERDKALAEGTLIDSDYLALYSWAASLPSACKAPRVRAMIVDFAAHILRTFGDLPVTTEAEELALSLLADPNRRRTALHLLSASDAMMAQIARRGDEHVREQLGTALMLGQQRLDPDARWSGHDIILDERAPFKFKVEFGGYQLSAPFYGLWLSEGATSSSPYPVLRRDLEASGGVGGKSGRHWIWWREVEDGLFGVKNASDEVALWDAIVSGEFARLTVAAATRAHADLRKAGILPWGNKKFYRVS